MCLNEWSLSAQNFYQNCKTGKACGLCLAAQPLFTSPNAARRFVTKNKCFQWPLLPAHCWKCCLCSQWQQLLRGEQLAEQVKGKKADGNAVHWIKYMGRESVEERESQAGSDAQQGLSVSEGTAPLSISLLSIRALWADGTIGIKSKEEKKNKAALKHHFPKH